jgi:hypothetical protein
MTDTVVNSEIINNTIYNKIKDNDMIIPILFLTIMNNQNKKNHISMQGYYIASSIAFLICELEFIENKSNLITQLSIDDYIKMSNILFINSTKSLQQNIESIKNTYQSQPQNLVNIITHSLSIFNSTFKVINSYNDYKFNFTNKGCNNNVITWYLKNNTELIDKFKTFKQLTKESLNEYIDKKYVSICELSIVLGWIIGGGEIKEITRIKKSARYFAIMYKISKDFENLSNDIKNSDKYSANYVLNYGLQDAYELFLDNKQKFIEESMIEDIYTNTVKEIIDTIEVNVDLIIDQTSPDLKSSYSSKV